jgi:hypothetical protein
MRIGMLHSGQIRFTGPAPKIVSILDMRATEAALPFRVFMQPHSIPMKLCDQPIDAFDLRWVSRRTQ